MVFTVLVRTIGKHWPYRAIEDCAAEMLGTSWPSVSQYRLFH